MSTALELLCRSCGARFDASTAPLTCPSCNALVPPHPAASTFARLGLDRPRFVVDEKALEATWLQRSRVVHPDKAMRKSDHERRCAVEQTAALNDAWRLLRVPFDRALLLLRMAGVPEPTLRQAQLVAFMEAREEAEESAERKAAVVVDSVARFRALMAKVALELQVVDDVAGGYGAPSPELPRLRRVGELLAEAKTLARLVDDLGGERLLPSLEGR
ncbi:MAG: hypothetical protein Q8O67_10155 [Deltaproteobacteria bacterium]|nr:hypothetical protein [Deltaproteobacteria bacterium]